MTAKTKETLTGERGLHPLYVPAAHIHPLFLPDPASRGTPRQDEYAGER